MTGIMIALRGLIRSPGHTILAVARLALGIVAVIALAAAAAAAGALLPPRAPEPGTPGTHTASTLAADSASARLAAFGQVWGFLKYHHPAVAAGTIDWDSAGTHAIGQARAARTHAEFAAVLQSLIDAAGPVPPCAECATPPDALWINHDERWLHGEMIGAELRRQLEHVRESRHRGSGRYVRFPLGTDAFAGDTALRRPTYPPPSHRVLALYRFWNAVHYYFAYSYVNDGDWDAVLREFVPRLLEAGDAAEYHRAILELTTRVNDTHVTTTSAVIDHMLGAHVPPFAARWIEGSIVVVPQMPVPAAEDSSFRPGGGGSGDRDESGDRAGHAPRPGDVITHVDGTPVTELRRRLAPYVAAGSADTFERKLVQLVLRTAGDSGTYDVLRDGTPLRQRVAMLTLPPPPASAPPERPEWALDDLVRVLPGNIGHVDLGGLEPAQAPDALERLAGVEGLVLDVRNYPRGTMFHFAAFLLREQVPFVLLNLPDSTFPGAYVRLGPLPAGPSVPNPRAFSGRVAILVDERTQSHAEFTVMALQTAPQHRVIGGPTAGADGNVVALELPGGIRTLFTAVGVYYPDGRQTQRVGIVPDIEVRPTIAGIRAGRDEVLERALEYVRTGR